MAEPKTGELMEKIVSLCKRRGLIFQSSEIYGGLNGFWDYGPLGAELKRNIKEHWWRSMTQLRDDVVGLDASIIMHPKIWEASGHTSTFSDLMVDCLLTKKRFRADQIEPQSGMAYFYTGATDSGSGRASKDAFSVLIATGKHADYARKVARQFYQQRGLENPSLEGERTEAQANTTRYNPENGSLLTEPRPFNLMLKTYVGPVESADNISYLRPETAQAIFVQFKSALEVSRQRVPFGICQVGKAFRNEINPRNFTFRSREFEQMELEFFIRPDEVVQKMCGAVAGLSDCPPGALVPQPNWGWELWHKYWVEQRIQWYESIGLGRDTLVEYWQKKEELAHYAKATVDILYKFPFGTQELEGVAARGDFDLTQHQKFSGKSMEYFDEEAKAKYVPHVIEPSAGVDRLTLALICNAYCEDQAPDEKGNLETRVVMRFHPRIAPIKVAVFPLLKNKPELVKKAREVRELLRPHMTVFYDEAGAIGRRYRRQDEAGTPFGVTIDFDTLGEQNAARQDTVTLRDRDTMKQERVKIADLVPLLREKIQ
ncbi:MAG: glycine--tRNA ligase [Verrucomicrobia bacterium]|jgi:glycyl-tRNA synthetase|nr:glycine--tRNA ligase [Verrucomicrobiota bacterium]HCL92282.1 glycine--tRNA ligase [Limisphaerales bacterium]HRY59724.1 glycine--tRNA ligase [Candidatus Paceibacterota bacterium]HOS75970.1 glycine--tRNA ligase [Verrucomicrobiota bacterium]HOW80435.1 glycine--tRNA ligase [Verrucomicrobiota bacterium]